MGEQRVRFFAGEQVSDVGLEPLLVGERAGFAEPNEAGANQRRWAVGTKPCGHEQPDGPLGRTGLTVQTRHPGTYDGRRPTDANDE